MHTAFEIEHAPAYASLRLKLQPNQTIVAEAGAMMAMDPWIVLKSKLRGGLLKGVSRMLGGESLFLSEFTSPNQSGELWLSPGIPGEICHHHLKGTAILVQSAGFVASSSTVTLDTKFQGFRGFFSGESLFLLRATGTGDLWFSSYGAVLEIPVDGDYIVDTGYIVAFEDTLDYSVEVINGLSYRGLMTGILGGEGLVCRFRGQGKLWIQSRELSHLINYLNAFRPTKG
jgi:uncharacterized protein (TIGR00266 family)